MANYPYLSEEEFKPQLLNSIFQYASELFDKNPDPTEDELKSINEEVNKRADNFCEINGYRKTFTVNVDIDVDRGEESHTDLTGRYIIITPSVRNYTLEVLEPKQKFTI